MDRWAKKTVDLANKRDYLDRLYEIYPSESGERKVDEATLKAIREKFNRHEAIPLLELLLDLDRFPIKDSYVSFLRTDREAIRRNPKTVRRITDTLFKLGFDRLREGILAPKEANRMRGQQFRRWLLKKFAVVDLDSFVGSSGSICFLRASEKSMLDFCNTQLKLGLQKRPDFVGKSGRHYVVGEAKFLSSSGGEQGGGFRDAIKLAAGSGGKAYRVAAIDGEVWIKPGSQEYREIEYSGIRAFSALLLNDFMRSL